VELGQTRRETFIPQVYDWGVEAQVDWYEAIEEMAGEMRKVYGFSMRSMASGGAFHVAYYHATQQAFNKLGPRIRQGYAFKAARIFITSQLCDLTPKVAGTATLCFIWCSLNPHSFCEPPKSQMGN
jgi:hypothetical protein